MKDLKLIWTNRQLSNNKDSTTAAQAAIPSL